MVKMVFLCRRRSDIDHDTYVERLLRGHVPIALKHHPAMRRYVVNIVEQSPAGWEELDSVGELWFDGLDDYRKGLYDSPEGKEIVQQDVRGFIGVAHAYATTEYVQRDDRGRVSPGKRSPGVKMICPLVRRSGMSHDEFVQHWLTRHAPLARRHHPGLRRYVTNVVDQRLSDTGEDLDGIAELHFATESEARERLFDSAEGERIVREDMARFIDRADAYLATEYVQKLG